MKEVVRAGVVCIAIVGALFSFAPVAAEQYSGGSYKINGTLGTSTGSMGSSDNYQLESTSGESIVGNASGGSYKMFQGYLSDTTPMLRLSIDLSGLVASYPLNESSGNFAYDYSSYRAYGTGVNAPTQGAGKLGNALTFNGSNQSIDIGDNTQTQLTGDGTVEAWVQTSVSSGDMAVVAKSSSFWLGISSGHAALYDWTSTTMCADTLAIADGNWHHIVATLDSGVSNGSTIYVDGAVRTTCTWTPVSQSAPLAIGVAKTATPTYSQFFNGSIDHVKIFNRILSAVEVAVEYGAQNAGNATGLTLGQITPGVSNSADFTAIVATNSNDYALSMSQNHDLQQASDTIPAIAAVVASPAAWVEGTTKGLGFTLLSGPSLDGKWASGSNYAALPNSSTTFYSRTSMSLGASDTIAMRLRADAIVTQPMGDYSNVMTITGTTLP